MKPSPRPTPGYRIDPEDDAYLVTDEDREDSPALERALVIRELDFEYGQGLGAEPYGYFTRTRVVVAHAEEPCPKCGHEFTRESFSQDHAAIAWSFLAECNACGHVIEDEFDC